MAPTTPSATAGMEVEGSPDPLPGLDEDPPEALALVPGDVVSLRLTSAETETVGGLSVDARGVLHVPLAGDVEVNGLPLVEAEQRIEEAMQRYDATVRVTVLLAEAGGHQATVIGAVERPGRFALIPGMRLADLIALAGGTASAEGEDGIEPLPRADLHGARLVRGGETVPVSLALALTGDPRHNVRLHAGDHVYVHPNVRGHVVVVGEVNAQRMLTFRPGMSLTQAIALSGGYTRDASISDIRIVRGPSDNPTVYRADIDDLQYDEGPDPLLASGDIVFVTSRPLADFRDVMNAISPLVSVAATTAIGVIAVVAAAP